MKRVPQPLLRAEDAKGMRGSRCEADAGGSAPWTAFLDMEVLLPWPIYGYGLGALPDLLEQAVGPIRLPMEAPDMRLDLNRTGVLDPERPPIAAM